MSRKPRTKPCATGVHRPCRIESNESGMQRASWRLCGCALVRTAASRCWYFSGLLGDAVAEPDQRVAVRL
jgi:hypothetical protein